jgi:hypothetical protein
MVYRPDSVPCIHSPTHPREVDRWQTTRAVFLVIATYLFVFGLGSAGAGGCMIAGGAVNMGTVADVFTECAE